MDYTKKKENTTNIGSTEILSSEISEIVGYVPSWIIRWGMTLLLIIASSLLFLSWLIKYPDTIAARVNITTENPPTRIVARRSGKLLNLFYTENQKVEKNAIIAVINNPAKYTQIVSLDHFLTKITKKSKSDDLFSVINQQLIFNNDEHFTLLGELQNSYTELVGLNNKLNLYLNKQYNSRIIEELKKNKIEFRGPLILGKGESVHFKDLDGNHLEIRCPADL